MEKQKLLNNVGNKLRKIRREKKLSLIELSSISGIDKNTISCIENGQSICSLNTLHAITEALDTFIVVTIHKKHNYKIPFTDTKKLKLTKQQQNILSNIERGINDTSELCQNVFGVYDKSSKSCLRTLISKMRVLGVRIGRVKNNRYELLKDEV